MPKIILLSKNGSEQKEVEVPSGCELLKISDDNPAIALKFGCRRGECGVCAIEIIEGGEKLNLMSEQEKEILKNKGLHGSYRLACQCALNHNITIIPHSVTKLEFGPRQSPGIQRS